MVENFYCDLLIDDKLGWFVMYGLFLMVTNLKYLLNKFVELVIQVAPTKVGQFALGVF